MPLTQYYVASSLDGFIAAPGDSLDWLFTRKGDDDGLLNMRDFAAGVGAMAMGATTYEWVLEHDTGESDPDGWTWPPKVPCWVFTHRELPSVPGVRFTQDDVASVHEEMVAAAGERNVWLVGGGDLVGQFADAGLLDEVLVNLAPVTLGAGSPLLPRHVELRLEETGRNGDFVAARLSVAK